VCAPTPTFLLIAHESASLPCWGLHRALSGVYIVH
jgi:hypothetical protein